MFSKIKIGYQQWQKKDLSIDDGLGGIKVIDGIYYYEWDAAMRVASQIKGYHIPSHEEFMKAIELCKCKYEPCEQIWNFSYTGIESFKKKFGFIPGAGYEFGHSAYTISGIQVDTGFISKDWARYWCSDLAKDTETTMSRAHHFVTITDKDDIWIGRDSSSRCYRVRLIKDNDVVETCGIIHTIEKCVNKLGSVPQSVGDTNG